MDSENRRKFTRIPFRTQVQVEFDEGILLIKTLKDLSLGGAFLICERPAIPVGSECTLQIELIGPATLLRIKLEAQVVRLDKDGVAVAFTKTDLDSLVHLRHLIAVSAGDTTEAEFLSNLLELPS